MAHFLAVFSTCQQQHKQQLCVNLWLLGGLLSTLRYFPLTLTALPQLRLIKNFHGAEDIATALGSVAVNGRM